VAGKALHEKRTLARRWQALLAFLFGLVHGLGVCGRAEGDRSPQQHPVTALLTFNAGVEVGQLLVV
jgi:hypothetical protein